MSGDKKLVKAFEDTYKGHRVLAIWEIDEKGEKQGKFPVVSFGQAKAEAILSCIAELQSFIKR